MRQKRICSLVLLLVLLAALLPGKADMVKAASLQEFAAMVEEHTDRLETSFSVPCEWTVTEELRKISSVGKDTSLLSEIMMRAGCACPYSVAWLDNEVRLAEVDYYAGWRILRLWETGKTGSLSGREKQVLDAALALVSGASGSDLEKERYIYDALSARVTYETVDDGTRDKDCAIGALLNGRADCDGYADAMVLCCGLAGIPCRYIHGASAQPPKGYSGENSHMWNLVYVGGSWLMCDATWGDQDRQEPCYLYFNLGRRDASLSYYWNTDTQFPDISSMTDFDTQLMPDQRPAVVYTQEEVYRAARAAVTSGQHHLSLYCPEEVFWQTDRDTFLSMLYHGGVGAHSYGSTGRLYEISDIQLPELPFCFCDSREDILSAVQSCADRDIRSFMLFFPPALADELLANRAAPLQDVLSSSCLEKLSYLYSTDSGSVTLTDVSFTAAPPACSSVEEILALIRRELPVQPASLTFLLPEGLALESIREQLSTAVYSLGVSSFSYSWNGRRVTLADLVYYDFYCLAGSENEILSFLKSARSAGRKELRVYCTDALYASMKADNASAFFSLLKKAGFKDYSVYTSDVYRMIMADGLK